ncbi:MAG: 5-(carboxyamino)imidazole ribonucleotide mutase [Bacteroidia bacterium]|nr:5-(carboxyamino)imidazole ribonucleotide mutase [Bacteroidia bacterium]
MVAIIMGSQSDWKIMEEASTTLKSLEIPHLVDIVSAHRTPEKMFAFAKQAELQELKVIVAGAGGAAHLPGMIASLTHLPVIGVPIQSYNSIAVDSILSILQMPPGIPVATVALNGAKNAALLAAQILSISYPTIAEKIKAYRKQLTEEVLSKAQNFSFKWKPDT